MEKLMEHLGCAPSAPGSQRSISPFPSLPGNEANLLRIDAANIFLLPNQTTFNFISTQIWFGRAVEGVVNVEGWEEGDVAFSVFSCRFLCDRWGWAWGWRGLDPPPHNSVAADAKSQPQTVTRCYIATSRSGEVELDFFGSLCVKGEGEQKLVCNFPSAFCFQSPISWIKPFTIRKKQFVKSPFFRLLAFF